MFFTTKYNKPFFYSPPIALWMVSGDLGDHGAHVTPYRENSQNQDIVTVQLLHVEGHDARDHLEKEKIVIVSFK